MMKNRIKNAKTRNKKSDVLLSSSDLIRDKSIMAENDRFESMIDLDDPFDGEKKRMRNLSKRTERQSDQKMHQSMLPTPQSEGNMSFRSTKIPSKVPT